MQILSLILVLVPTAAGARRHLYRHLAALASLVTRSRQAMCKGKVLPRRRREHEPVR